MVRNFVADVEIIFFHTILHNIVRKAKKMEKITFKLEYECEGLRVNLSLFTVLYLFPALREHSISFCIFPT